jgi:cytochrome c-type biogenesis protein CcmF
VSLVLLVLTVHFLGFAKAQYLVLLFFAFLIFAGNLFVLVKKIKINILARSDLLAHLGVGLMLIGIIISSVYSSSNRIVLPLSETKQVFGYNLTFLGTSSLKENNFLTLQIEKNIKKKVIQTAFYFSEYSQGIVREPYVMSELWGDLYLAPVELQEQAQGEQLELEKGQTKDIAGYKIKFLQFEIASHNQTDFIQVGAILEILKGKEKQKLTPFIVIGNDEQDNHRKISLFNTKDYIYLEKIDADSKKIFLRIGNENKIAQPVLALEISKKPFIWTLWLGTIIVLIGFIVSAKNHFRKQTK